MRFRPKRYRVRSNGLNNCTDILCNFAYWMPLPPLLLVTVLPAGIGDACVCKKGAWRTIGREQKAFRIPLPRIFSSVAGPLSRSSSDKSLRRKKTKKTTTDLKMTMMTMKKTTDTPPAFVSGEG